AGYARIATLGEEVADPARTIPRAIPLALGITLVVYAAVAVTALVAAGAEGLARAPAPLVAAIAGGRYSALAPAVRIGATVASLGVLLSLLAGVSRTAFAMAGNGDLPTFLASVHPRYRVPDRAELLVGASVAGRMRSPQAALRDAHCWHSASRCPRCSPAAGCSPLVRRCTLYEAALDRESGRADTMSGDDLECTSARRLLGNP